MFGQSQTLIMSNTPLPSNAQKVKWVGTQAEFVALIEALECSGLIIIDDSIVSGDEIAETFMNLINVDLAPFPDFRIMRMTLEGNTEPLKLVDSLEDSMKENYELDNALDGTGVFPSEEEQKKQIMKWALIHMFVDKMRKHMHIPKE